MKLKKIVRRQSRQDFAGEMHPVLKKLFSARGITTMESLDYSLAKLLPYSDLLGITAAADLLYQAIQQQQKILIIGDFDADGATSTALSVRVLKAFGAKHVDYLVPNRFDFGYGLTPEIVEVAKTMQPDLIMTVDNGIVNYAGVDAAKAAGIKIIITDHHLAGETLPNADAIVNPNQPNDQFPSKNLAGVGVAFYVMLALRAKLREENWFESQSINPPNMSEFLDIVALGTVADVVPLDHNNRILVYQGLRRIRAGKTVPGIRALLEIAKRILANITAQDLGFAVGPRLNAAGRMDDMTHGIACLLTDNDETAWQYANELDNFNQERKSVEQTMQTQALQDLKKISNSLGSNKNLPWGLCLFDKSWHQGVIGILASRIKERTHRPVIIFAQDKNNIIKGSSRSIPGVHIRDVLAEVDAIAPGLILKFGGHAMAAGLSIELENLEKFKHAFNQVLDQKVDKQLFEGVLETDGEIHSEDFTLRFAEIIADFGPWGQNFPAPCFDGKFKIIDQRVLSGKHLKLIVSPENSETQIDAIAFNIDIDQWPGDRCRKVVLVYSMDINEFRGRRKLQLMIEQIEPIQIMELA